MEYLSLSLDLGARIQLSLALGWLVFEAVYRWGCRFSPQRQLAWLRLGQGMVLATIFMPMVSFLIPNSELPSLPLIIGEPVSEISEGIASSVAIATQSLSTFQEALPKNLVSPFWGQDWKAYLPLVLMMVWLGGFFLYLLRFIYRFTAVAQLLRRAVPIRKLGLVRIMASSEVSVPFSVRWRGLCWVVLPAELLQNWNQSRLALHHEIQHHRQRDTHWAVWMEWVVAISFWNPFVRLWRRRISALQELTCDEAVIMRPKVSGHDYGNCLLSVAENALKSRLMLVGTTCMAADSNYSQLKRRIQMIKQYRPMRANDAKVYWLGTILLVSSVAIAFANGGSVRKPELLEFDQDIQKITEHALRKGVTKHKAIAGFAFVSDPNSGKLLAVASVSREKKFDRRWALALRLYPASVIKPLVAAFAVDTGVTKLEEIHNCENGRYLLGGKVYADWKPFGKLSTKDSVIYSSNICGIKVARRLGADGLSRSLYQFGIGDESLNHLIRGSKSGMVPSLVELPDPHFTARVSIGFGLYASGLEVLQAYGAIANGGNLMQPIPANSNEGKIIRRVITEKTSKEMREVLAEVMTKGTAKNRGSKKYRLAGKTGTGYNPWRLNLSEPRPKANIATFAGFGPVSHPRVNIYVGLYFPSNRRAHGSRHAAPIFTEIAEGTLKHWGVPESK